MTLMKWTNNPVLNEMFNGMYRRPVYHTCDHNRPAANILDNEKDFTIELAVPGMHKDQFRINLENDVLTISVERKENEVEEKMNYTRREFRYDEFSRSFSLPEIVDQDNIKADYVNGVLSVTLPKTEEVNVKSKEIKIS